MPGEIPILPRRPETSASTDPIAIQSGWHPQRWSSYYSSPPPFNHSYGRSLMDGRGSILDGPRTILMALDNVLQMLCGWSQMIDGTYYTWTTSVSMVVSLWEHISDLLEKCKRLLLAVLKWWVGVICGKHGSISFSSILENSWNHSSESIPRSKMFSTVGVILLVSALVLSIIKRKRLLEENGDSQFIKLTTPVFAKVMYDFQAQKSDDVKSLEKDQLVAITQVPEGHVTWNSERTMSSLNERQLNNEPTWLYGRTRNGEYGVFPSNYVSIVDMQSSA